MQVGDPVRRSDGKEGVVRARDTASYSLWWVEFDGFQSPYWQYQLTPITEDHSYASRLAALLAYESRERPIPAPLLMICEKAGECANVGCYHRNKHVGQMNCHKHHDAYCHCISGTRCVPYVEPEPEKWRKATIEHEDSEGRCWQEDVEIKWEE